MGSKNRETWNMGIAGDLGMDEYRKGAVEGTYIRGRTQEWIPYEEMARTKHFYPF